MKLVLWILLALAGTYLVFIVGPALIMFNRIFGRLRAPSFAQLAAEDPCYRPFLETAEESIAFLRTLPKEQVSISGADGISLTADYVDMGCSSVVAFFHGYHASAELNFFSQARLAAEQGYDLLLVDQRGHGRSTGRSTLGISEQQDVLDWVAYLKARPGVDRIFLYGVSMGATAIAYSSDRLDRAVVKGMILDCGFNSPYEQIARESKQRHLPTALLLPIIELLATIVLKQRIRTTVAVSLHKTSIPALFVHGGKDTTVLPESGKRSYEACASQKEWLCTEHATHTLAIPAGGAAAESRLLAFLSNDSYQGKIENRREKL